MLIRTNSDRIDVLWVVGIDWLDSIRAGLPVEALNAVPSDDVLARLVEVFPDAERTKKSALDWEGDSGAWTAKSYAQGIELVLWDEVPDDVLNAIFGVAEEFGLQPFSYPQ